ncbi:MAG: DUF423 domain-containing protein [Brucellaceae bacterium]|nr:DUF423 domain-containing protein [Brucellaceae bacterium]
MQDQRSRWLQAIAGLTGAAGVAAAAMAAHGGEERLMGAVAIVCLTHAPAFLALSARKQPLLFMIASLAMAAGLLLFCGDLAMRALHGTGLFPMAAPSGGLTLIAAWLLVAVQALLPAKRRT